MRSRRILLLCIAALCSSCAVIVGQDEPSEDLRAAKQIRFVYVETLRDENSLSGESLREVKDYDDPVKAGRALQRPTSVAADPFRIYVTDRSPIGRLAMFDRGLRTMTTQTGPIVPAPMAGEPFIEPMAVALDVTGYVYVADAVQGRVFGLDRNGALAFTIGKTGDLASPAALAVDSKLNRLYVADRNAHAVRIYDFRGHPLFSIQGSSKKGDLRMPVGVAVDRDGRCYVLDGTRKRVYVYDRSGVFLRTFPVASGKGESAERPVGIAVDSAGLVYVSDQMSNRIFIFDGDGSFLQHWGRMGNRRDEFWGPAGIFIDQQDTIYIADEMNGRIQVYQREK